MQESPLNSISPSFNSYSNSKLAEIAARVVEEFGNSEELMYDEFYIESEENSDYVVEKDVIENNANIPELADEDEGFEFAFVTKDSELLSPISADEIFQNGQIRPVYPVFNRDLLLGHVKVQKENEKENCDKNSDYSKVPKIRLPLKKLFIEERETAMTTTTSSSSSSEADELDGLPAEMYCVWRPEEAAVGRCKKSSSTGSNSKRWKFKHLLNRSHSDGSKDNFVISSTSNSGRKKENEEKGKGGLVSSGKVKSAALPPPPPSYNRDGGENRRSYLPYKQDLLGLFGNVNGLSVKNVQPF